MLPEVVPTGSGNGATSIWFRQILLPPREQRIGNERAEEHVMIIVTKNELSGKTMSRYHKFN